MKGLIQLISITRTYEVGARVFHALRNVSLTIQEGEFLAIEGPSGSGKSTLLNLITGIDKPTAGEVWVGGRRIDLLDENGLARWRGQMIGVVFQFFQLLPTLTVLENVTLPLQLRRLWSQPDGRIAKAMLERVGMSAHLDKLPAELSGGEKQRVALARALINDPPILIADEPTGNLDSATGAHIIELLHEQHRMGKTVVMVTHESTLAESCSCRLWMKDGQVDGHDGAGCEASSGVL